MATRTKAAAPKRKPGRPSKYTDDTPRMAAKAAMLGATDDDLADLFDVTAETINQWKRVHPEFSDALKTAKETRDATVERRLFERATGYSHPEDDIRAVNGEIVITPTIKHYPPDTVAAIFWLKNRQPARWRQQPSELDEETVPGRVDVVRRDASIPDPSGG